ncbi:MAG: SUMF1/EgtB/PvdO family nonheme iron enzyme [Kiritimatiellia bacterium]
MNQQRNGIRLATIGLALFLTGARIGMCAEPSGDGGGDANVRFHGAPTFDFGVTNVKWEAGTADYSFVTFDLFWSYSWRQKWTEPARTSATGKDMEVESWDAAWVFVKFLPDKDAPESIERNHWQHASLDTDAVHHVMPAGATNSVKRSDDGSRGMGVFIYRDAVGYGTNDWKHIKLRWLHGAAKVDPSKAAVRVFPIPMVYVPQGPFKIGTGGASGISRFPDGLTLPSAQGDHMPGPKDLGSLTDGSWRGGPVVPFLADAEWNGPAAEGSRARRIGAAAGQLWTTLTYVEVGVGGSSIGDPGVLGDEYPTGYEPFYCMKYDVTQGQYVDYLNALPPDVAAGRSCLGSEVGCDYPMPRGLERGGLTISLSGGPTAADESEASSKQGRAGSGKAKGGGLDMDQMIEEAERAEAARAEAARAAEERKGKEAGSASVAIKLPPAYSARLPFRSCSGISKSDMYAYAIWTGMRPMSELEFEKARRGARNPVPHENDTGTTLGASADVEKDMVDCGSPEEGFRRGNSAGGYGSMQTVFRVGCFATPTSDRVAANATYWGILELGGNVVSALRRDFRGTHGDGTSLAGKPGAALQRGNAPCIAPEDWPKRIGGRGGNDRTWINNEYIDGRFVWNRARLVISAENRIKKAAPKTGAVNTSSTAVATRSAGPDDGGSRQTSSIKVSNVKWEAGTKEYSTVSFDLVWDNSWRAKCDEPAEKSVTGRPLRLESRDAAWVFLKFRQPGLDAFQHARLSPNAADHRVPAGAALDVGLSDAGTNGVGVFIYRSAVGSGANDFKSIKLRWMHPPAPRIQGGRDAGVTPPPATPPPAPIPQESGAPNVLGPPSLFDAEDVAAEKAAAAARKASAVKAPAGASVAAAAPAGKAGAAVPAFDPGKAEVKVHAMEMVYVPQGAFQSKVPWTESLKTIRSAVATEEDGCRDMENPPDHAEYPNGYKAFYCAKYAISQGQYADYLNSLSRAQAAAEYPGAYGINRFTIQCDTNKGVFAADVPGRPCNFLRWNKILNYEAWAGLRPLTDLEYEKACRGARAVARREDAWAAGMCAPAAGIGKELLPPLPDIDAGASYWGIRGLSLSGCVHEWPGIIFPNKKGSEYRGSHGDGSPTLPADWPGQPVFGQYGDKNMGYGAVWMTPDNLSRTIAMGEFLLFDNTGRYGARAVRTAPVRQDETAVLQLEALPNLQGYDVGIFWLAGRFRHEGGSPEKVEVSTSLPDACFVEGAASRVFMAAPKAITPFRILVAVTRMNAVKAMQGEDSLLFQIRAVGGEVLGDQTVKLTMAKGAVKPPCLRSLDGGTIEARLRNASDRPVPVSVVLDAARECKLTESERRVEIAAGQDATVTYPVSRQALPVDGVRGLPFRVTVAKGAVQEGELTVNLENQSRWWLGRKVVGGLRGEVQPDADAPVGSEEKAPDAMPAGLFTMAERPPRWKVAEVGVTNIPLEEAGAMPARGSSVIASSRLFAPADREVTMKVAPEKIESDILRIWVNEAVVYDSRTAGQVGAKPIRLRAGMNMLVAGWRSVKDGAHSADPVAVTFQDAKTGQAVTDLVLDMEGK